MNTFSNKRYEKCLLSENLDIFEGYYADKYEVPVDILIRLSKDLGFSYQLYTTIYKSDKDSAQSIVKSMGSNKEILFLLDEESSVVIDYAIDIDRIPVLNSEFINRVESLVGTSDAIEISERYYHKDDKVSSVILKKKSPIIIEDKYLNRESDITEYDIGVLVINDEMSTTSSRLILYVNHQPLYLPASYYSSSSSRYKRSTPTSIDSLEVLILKIIDDLREEELKSKIQDIHYKYRANKDIAASYEEYNTLLRTMKKIPTIIDDNSVLDSLLAKYNEFEKRYNHVEDQKSSYIWRCTALSDVVSLGSLISMTTTILSELLAPSVEYYTIRELLGSYVSTNRIAEEIAKEDIT